MAGEMNCIVLLSGGMDSGTLLALAKVNFDKVSALSIDYAQRHKRELNSAVKLAQHYNVRHKILDVSNINALLQGSSLTSDDISVPHGHYADESMKLTVVPARNTILLSIVAGWAISMGFTHVAYAAHAGDHAIYPDCRPKYVEAMQGVFDVFHYWPIKLWTPFLEVNKSEILRIGLEHNVPYELTWTCYDPQGTDLACGKCGSCTERLEAFRDNNSVDPLNYVQ
jgi:7-cyano-7-deazaguanine synthase